MQTGHNTGTMLTKFITSQHDYGGLCLGINNSLNLQESRHLPSSSLSLAIDIRHGTVRHGTVSCIHDLVEQSGPLDYSLPSFFSSPSLSFSSFFHFTHLQPDALLTDVESQVQLSELVKTSLTDAKPSKLILKRHQPTYLRNSLCMESTTI